MAMENQRRQSDAMDRPEPDQLHGKGFGLAGHGRKSDSQIPAVLADDANLSVFRNETRKSAAIIGPKWFIQRRMDS
jgi:hypothetical protein